MLPDYSWCNVPKTGKINPMTVKCTKWLLKCHHFPFQGTPKHTQIAILGMKKYHLATPVKTTQIGA
jgi:hypothetical protein